MSELEALQKTIEELRGKLQNIPAYDSKKIDALYTRIQALEDKIASIEIKPVKETLPPEKRARQKKEKQESKIEPKPEPKEEEEEPWWTRV